MSLNQGGITTVTGLSENQILAAPELSFTLPCRVADTGVTANGDGKKIIYAGTPLYGALDRRHSTEPFHTSGKDNNEVPVGITIHDIDVTAGEMNAQICVFGFVDIKMLNSQAGTLLLAHKPAGITVFS